LTVPFSVAPLDETPLALPVDAVGGETGEVMKVRSALALSPDGLLASNR
jgi:hypothetical protein